MPKLLKYIALCFLVLVLLAIRFFEDRLFYDPYLTFFKNDYLYLDSPRREMLKLVGFTTLRYALNTGVSLIIIFIIFRDYSMLKFAGIVYVASYIILMLLFLFFTTNPKQDDYYLFFNIRRFLIQPVLLILLLPAFYYNKIYKT